MKSFGKKEFDQVVYLNFESSERLKNIFVADFDINRIITVIEIEANQKIIKDNCLIIFDEIQEAEKGLTALKYFYEKAPEYYIISAGSLLGISMQHANSFPVGKVDLLQLNPLNFFEFLENTGDSSLANLIAEKNWPVIDSFHTKLISKLRLYYFIGGMPEAVADYIKNQDLEKVRSILQKLITGYEYDFTKHAPYDLVPKIKLVWQSLLAQLAKENRKFIYGQIVKGARAKDFEMAINWLVQAGLIIKVNRIEKPTIPLNAYANLGNFKLYLLDVGILTAMGDIDQKIILEKNDLLKEFKGALTEQYVCQELTVNQQLYFWSTSTSQAEIDFLFQFENEIIPIEVKAEENLKAKSLKIYVESFATSIAIRTSMSKYREEDWLINIPLYAIDTIGKKN